MTRCNWVSCDHDMMFSKGLNYILICPHCGHLAHDQSEALRRIRRAQFIKFGLPLIAILAIILYTII